VFSVCIVSYGNHKDLLERSLSSIERTAPSDLILDVRVGINDVSETAREYVMNTFARRFKGIECIVYEPTNNVGKYPLMRRMFYDAKRPLADWIMWFDDDSHLDDSADESWWRATAEKAVNCQVMGAIHTIRQRGMQWQGIQQQPWYGQMKVDEKHKYRFATGAWWTAQSEFITRWGYPFPEIYHNGGDSILGELVRQQRAGLGKFDLLRCHCESCEKKDRPRRPGVVHVNMGGRKGRRGIGKTGEVYPWQSSLTPSTNHQNFELKIYRFGGS